MKNGKGNPQGVKMLKIQLLLVYTSHMQIVTKKTLETSGEDVKNTLETSGEDTFTDVFDVLP